MKELNKKERNWKRIGRGFLAYTFGIALGTFLVWALWLRNRDTPNMWPTGMVKDRIVRSSLGGDSLNSCYLSCTQLNDSLFKQAVLGADVRFRISKTRRKPAPVYALDINLDSGVKMRWWIESGDSIYNIFKVEDLPGTTLNHTCNCKPVNF